MRKELYMTRVDEFYKMIEEFDGNTDEIINPIINDFNEAMNKYLENKKSNKKAEDAQALADHFNAFIKVWYPTTQSEIKGSEIIEILNFTEKLLDPEASIDDVIAGVFSAATPLKKKTTDKKKSLSDMVAEMGW